MKYSSTFFLPAIFVIVSCWQQVKSSNEAAVSSVQFVIDTLKPFGTYLHFDTIPFNDPDLISPGRGVYQWMGLNSVDIVEGKKILPQDAYYRFTWNEFEDEKENVYNWSTFDAQINKAIDNRQKFSFRIMPTCTVCSGKKINDASIQYPLWLHNKMQNENVKDWVTKYKMWEPNWNSSTYLNAWKALNVALNDHINTTTYKNVAYRNVIYFIDASGWGNFGEWQNSYVTDSPSDYPQGAEPTVATFDSLIAYQLHSYPDFLLVAFPGVWDGHQLKNTWVDPAVGYYATFARNNAGPLGYRRDNFGALDNYIDNNWGINNPVVFNNVAFDTVIRNRYKYAMVTGEPIQNGNPVNGCDYGDLVSQVRKYHVSSFANGNFAESDRVCMRNNVRLASKTSGYRLQIKSGSISSTVSVGDSIHLLLNWYNSGIAPVYENRKVQFELRSDSTVLQTWVSSFNPRLFLPGIKSFTDYLTLQNSVQAGSYQLYIIINDPNGYRQPLLLMNTNVQSDGSYFISKLIITDANKKSGH
ncbi:MAG: DUF4832 domain-containing protein [Bacteroidetes bacterium]|nr:DUF4832 domain-containing protein [Bacteroidota bacterium]